MDNIPNIKLSQQAVSLRIRENKWAALNMALNDLFMDMDYQVNIPMLCDEIQASLTSRMGLIDDLSNEHANLQQDVDIFNCVAKHTERNYEHDTFVISATKLIDLKEAICKLEAK